MKAALREGSCPVRFFAEQDFLNGFFKAGGAKGGMLLQVKCGTLNLHALLLL